MSIGQLAQSRSSRFAGMLAGVVAPFWFVGCGHSDGRESMKPTTTVTLGNEAASVEPTAAESTKLDADVVPASNELPTNAAGLKPTESAATEKPAADQPMSAADPEATRTFSVEGPDHAIRVSFDDFDLLKVMNLDPVPLDAVGKLPKWLKALDGKRVRVRGFMYPPFSRHRHSRLRACARQSNLLLWSHSERIRLGRHVPAQRCHDQLHSEPPVRCRRHLSHQIRDREIHRDVRTGRRDCD